MPDILLDAWQGLAPSLQDGLVLAGLLAPAVLTGLVVTFGFRPLVLVPSLIWRYRWTNLVFVALIAVSVGLGVGLTAQERGLRQGTARAAEKFDLIVAAPGSEITMLFAAVYLQPSDVPLLDGAAYQRIVSADNVSLAAPIAYGDSHDGAPVIGTTPQFVSHLSGALVEGRLFGRSGEAVAGSAVSLRLGAEFTPAHGMGDEADAAAHAGAGTVIVGRMAATGSPWDKAILVPVEAVWEVHGLANGHAPERSAQIGPPFDPEHFPGTPAVMVHAETLWASYALQSEFTTDSTMAFFPGTVLSRLHGLMGDVRQIMSMMAIVTQVLVTAGVLTGLVVLTRLFARRLALLRALGAPRRFVFSVVWCYAATLIGGGALLGLAVGHVATGILSREISRRTDILVDASLAWPEFHLIAGFVSMTMLLALLPAFLALTRPVIDDLRG
ncbi:putative ABC transport system permease protein [Hoeflea marina]|uniref:Putative ABC transport system permease protein n=1 Tax=Hoeflea marina TaxID=274592 RepID=A0A317PJP1_9HYPH|nr:FtsX-like permease family protein [Hoeflea marina]PWV98779.1 putative ABC transport system permease protein [Hoeflea marina]